MYWKEDIKEENFVIPDNVVDAQFSIESKIIPIDHGYLLYKAILKLIPDIESKNIAIHDISVADGNGWEQKIKGGFFYPSKRTKLTIRIEKKDIEILNILVGANLEMDDYSIKITKSLTPKSLSDSPILFAKYVSHPKNLTEDDFLNFCYSEIKNLDIDVKKMMPGLSREINTPSGVINTRSLMLADLRKSESVKIQEFGIGNHQLLGCGIFVPQKGIEQVEAV